jgi:hypothetical protein
LRSGRACAARLPRAARGARCAWHACAARGPRLAGGPGAARRARSARGACSAGRARFAATARTGLAFGHPRLRWHERVLEPVMRVQLRLLLL